MSRASNRALSHIFRIPGAGSGLRSRRGTILLAYLVLLPVALVLYLGLQTRLTIALWETRRDAGRVQARLLAESALAAWQARPGAAAPKSTGNGPLLEGRFDGIGQYQVLAAPGGDGALIARGIVTQPRLRLESDITFTPAPRPQLTAQIYRLTPFDEPAAPAK